MAEPDFPFPLKSVAGDVAESMLLKMRGDLQAKCLIPVILGDKESVSDLSEIATHNQINFDEFARSASTVLPEDWLAGRVKEEPDCYPSLSTSKKGKSSPEPMMRLSVGFQSNGKPVPEVFIAQLPGPEFWMLPLHLRIGSWNCCPEPFGHALMARYWEGRFGARLAVITADTIEFTVDHPPATDESCAQLAREQYIYCPDIVDQDVGSLAALAECLKNSRTWYFRWN
ncbi:MAG TPA: DUF4253 domain-containing protein [Verrucomicrobiae bacterium]